MQPTEFNFRIPMMAAALPPSKRTTHSRTHTRSQQCPYGFLSRKVAFSTAVCVARRENRLPARPAAWRSLAAAVFQSAFRISTDCSCVQQDSAVSETENDRGFSHRKNCGLFSTPFSPASKGGFQLFLVFSVSVDSEEAEFGEVWMRWMLFSVEKWIFSALGKAVWCGGFFFSHGLSDFSV